MTIAAGPAAAASGSGEAVELPELTIREPRESVWFTTSPTLRERLSTMPGVVTQEGFGVIDPPRLSLRGSGLQSAPVSRGVLWLIDGLPFNAVDGSFNSAVLDLDLAGAVELDRRCGGAVVALGGAINVVSEKWARPTSAGEGRRFSFAAGGERTRRALFASVAGDPTTPVAVWAAGSWLETEGWRPQSAQRRLALTAGGGRVWRDGSSFQARVDAASPRFDVPGPLTRQALATAPASISAAAAVDRPRRETEFLRASVALARPLGGGGEFQLGMVVQHTDDWFRQLRANGATATRGPDGWLRAGLAVEHGDHRWRAALQFGAGRRQQTRETIAAGAAAPRFADVAWSARSATVELEDRWSIAPTLELGAGAALLADERRSRGRPARAEGTRKTAVAAPHVHVRWRAAPHVRWHARVARRIEPPTFDDLLIVHGAPAALELRWNPLRIQRSDTIELGVRRDGARGSWEITGYAARWTGEILRLTDAQGAPLGAVNAGPTIHRGVEAAWRASLLETDRARVTLRLAHTWSGARFRRDPVHGGNRLGGLPPHAGSAELAWSSADGWFAVWQADWTAGRAWADHANQFAYGGRIVHALRIGWADRGRPGWSVFGGVSNVFDRGGAASTAGVPDRARQPEATAIFLPGAPRAWQAGVERRW